MDVLRGLAAFAVLLWHYQHFYYKTPGVNPIEADRSVEPLYSYLSFFYEHGGEAVELFWVISGFVFASVYLNTLSATTSAFIRNRFARLYPLHFLTLILVALLQWISLKQRGAFLIYGVNDAYHFVLNLFFIPAWGFETDFSFNAPIWSVSVELFVYAFFWVSLPGVIKRGFFAAAGWMLMFLGLQAVGVPGKFWWCGAFFYQGCCVFLFWRSFSAQNQLWVLRILCLMTGMIGYAASGLETRHASRLCQLAMFPAIVLLMATLDSVDTGKFGRRLRFLGNMTYSSYLLHIPIQITLLMTLDHFSISRGVVSEKLFFVSFLAAVIVLSQLCYYYVELPLQQRFSSPRHSSAAVEQNKALA